MKKILIIVVFVAGLLSFACARFRNAPATTTEARYVVISPLYNEIIWALGAQDQVVGVDLSITYPAEVKKAPNLTKLALMAGTSVNTAWQRSWQGRVH